MNKENKQSNHSMNTNKPFTDKDSIRVSVLSEALPYIQRFANKRIVIKYGGSAMADKILQNAVFRDLALLFLQAAEDCLCPKALILLKRIQVGKIGHSAI